MFKHAVFYLYSEGDDQVMGPIIKRMSDDTQIGLFAVVAIQEFFEREGVASNYEVMDIDVEESAGWYWFNFSCYNIALDVSEVHKIRCRMVEEDEPFNDFDPVSSFRWYKDNYKEEIKNKNEDVMMDLIHILESMSEEEFKFVDDNYYNVTWWVIAYAADIGYFDKKREDHE